MPDCAAVREDLGVYVLGVLGDAAAQVRRHLAGCRPCREVYEELAALPALLARLTPAEAEATGAGAETGPPGRVMAAAAGRAVRARRLRAAAAVAAAVLVAAGAGGGWLLGRPGEGGSDVAAPPSAGAVAPPPAPPSVPPAAHRTAASGAGAVTATVRYGPSAWGSSVELTMAGAVPGTRCQLDVYGTRGRQETASSWVVPPSYGAPGVTVPGGTSISPDEIVRFEVLVVGGDGDPIVRIEPSRPVR